jgi:WD40 repeat protein
LETKEIQMACKSAASRAVKTMLVALTIPLLAACDVEQRLAWSPDGNKLAVVGADGVRVSTDGGLHLSEPVEPEAKLLNWFADSKRLLVVSETSYESWEAAEKRLSKEDVAAVGSCASQLITELERCNGDLAACRDALKKNKFDATHLNAALFYLNATQGEKIRKFAGNDGRLFRLGMTLSTVSTYDVDKDLKLKETLFTTDRTFDSAAVSPSNEYFCFISGAENELLTAEAKNPKNTWKSFGRDYQDFPDWDINTDFIYALKSVPAPGKGKPDFELVSIDVKKDPAQAVKHLSDVYSAYDKVRATVDGNILFVASRAGSVPVGKYSSLFSYNLTSGKLKKLQSSSSATQLEKFEVSPDGNSVSIPGAYNALAVLNLQNGKRQIVAPAVTKKDQDTFVPVWRNNEELCFNRIQAGADKSTVALYSLRTGQSKDLSNAWPEKAVAGLLAVTDKTLSFDDFLKSLRE